MSFPSVQIGNGFLVGRQMLERIQRIFRGLLLRGAIRGRLSFRKPGRFVLDDLLLLFLRLYSLVEGIMRPRECRDSVKGILARLLQQAVFLSQSQPGSDDGREVSRLIRVIVATGAIRRGVGMRTRLV